MNQDEFKAKCAEAIKEWHDPTQDGPILVATREQTGFSLKENTWEEPFPEYASAIGEWPRDLKFNSDYYADFTQFTSQSIEALVRHAKELALMREPEPDEEEESPEVQAERKVYDDLLN